MASHHEPLKALGSIEWADVPQDDLKTFLEEIFTESQTIIDSVPSAVTGPAKAAATGRARAKTDSALVYSDVQKSLALHQSQASAGVSAQLQKEWKEVKTNPKENPHGISVYKLSGKDGKGAWFARRSVHEGLSFDQWKTGLTREFAESMKVQGAPGSGSIRGIGADKNVEHHVVADAGNVDVFQLSAQFPGPTAPRDFITLLLTSDFSHLQSEQKNPLRQYVVVSKPCIHPECPPRQGIIRGHYESVEIIREIPIENDSIANKRSLSSADLTSGDNKRTSTSNWSPEDSGPGRAVEWLMVTRSDPGGSVPRFLIEKGTPPGIVGDAGKFMDWVKATTSIDGSTHAPKDLQKQQNHSDDTGELPTPTAAGGTDYNQHAPSSNGQNSTQEHDAGYSDWIPSSTGLYGMITGAFGVATSVAGGLRSQFSNPLSMSSSMESLDATQPIPEENEDDESSSDASSVRSFTSALEKSVTGEKPADSMTGSNSEESKSQLSQPKEKELQKLVERRRRLEESFAKMQERMESKKQTDSQKDASTYAKLREKHDKEMAKQEAKYQKEMRKIEEKREQEERKAEARKKKAAEREEKSNLTLELEKARADRDVALKQAEILRLQVGELQSQNTMLVAKLGRLGGLDRNDSYSSSAKDLSIKSSPSGGVKT